MRRKHPLFAAAFSALILASGIAAAEDTAPPKEQKQTPEELAIEGMDSLMRALELLILQIPQYEMPEINDRGDIIIRRKNPPQPKAPEEQEEPLPEGDSTET